MSPRLIVQIFAGVFLLGLPALFSYMKDGVVTPERYDHYLLMLLTGWVIGGIGAKNE